MVIITAADPLQLDRDKTRTRPLLQWVKMSDVKNDFFSLSNDTLTIFWYYFPFGSKTIRLDEIEYFIADYGNLETLQYKSWGMALSSIWWAMGRRGLLGGNNSGNFIVKVKGSSIHKGFSMGANGADAIKILKDRGIMQRPSFN